MFLRRVVEYTIKRLPVLQESYTLGEGRKDNLLNCTYTFSRENTLKTGWFCAPKTDLHSHNAP